MAIADIHRYIDHSVLKPEMTPQEAAEAIELGLRYCCRTVCVRPCDIVLATRLCQGTTTDVCCTLAFPHGLQLSDSKADEARRYVGLGVREIDMVIHYGLLRAGLWQEATQDVAAVTAVTKPAGVLLKVILETSALSIEQIRRGTLACVAAGADFVKTSTGFSSQGATREAVAAMLQAAAGRAAVKASGGIRDRAAAEMFLDMGCARIGVGYASTPVICGQ